MVRYTMLLDWKNQYFQNDYTILGNLQVQLQSLSNYQWHFSQNLNKKNLNSYGNTKDLKLPKQYWERKTELEESDSLILDYNTRLQSSKHYSTGMKTEV